MGGPPPSESAISFTKELSKNPSLTRWEEEGVWHKKCTQEKKEKERTVLDEWASCVRPRIRHIGEGATAFSRFLRREILPFLLLFFLFPPLGLGIGKLCAGYEE